MEALFSTLIQSIGEDVNREGLLDTPKRAAESWKFLTQGYQQTVSDVVNGAIFKSDCKEMIIVKNIELYSLCEHHLLPFIGTCHVAYQPNGKILGL